MTDDVTPAPVLDPEPPAPAAAATPPGERRSSADVTPRRPAYKGEELDPARGPGLGCFWFQAAVLAFFLALIPVGVKLNWPFEILAALLFVALGLLLFVGQTLIFLLRLVAADRRDAGRRRPLASPTPTVGQLEDALLGAPGTADAASADVIPPDAAAFGGDSGDTAGTPASQAVEAGSEGVRE